MNEDRTRLFSAEQLADFRRDGYLVVRGLYDPAQMKQITRWTEEVTAFPEVPGKSMMYYEDSLAEPGKRIINRIENFFPYHAGFRDMFNGADMRGRCGELFGESAVLFKDKVNYKMPGANGFTPHQDVQAGWDDYASIFITALVTIDPATVENGCLELAPGFHDQGMIGELWEPLSEENMRGMRFEPYPTEPGDVVFFDSFAPHRSGPNLTDKSRRVLYVTYNKASEGDQRERYYADKRKSYPPDCEREASKAYSFRV